MQEKKPRRRVAVPLDCLVGREAFVVSSRLRVTLTKHIGDQRWLCTDEIGKCHPCYNLFELHLLPANDQALRRGGKDSKCKVS
jgi:hypothetical protein